MAMKMKEIFESNDCRFFIETYTNQLFIVLGNQQMEQLKGKVSFSFWEKYDDDHTVVRFATTWSTTEEDLKALDLALKEGICL